MYAWLAFSFQTSFIANTTIWSPFVVIYRHQLLLVAQFLRAQNVVIISLPFVPVIFLGFRVRFCHLYGPLLTIAPYIAGPLNEYQWSPVWADNAYRHLLHHRPVTTVQTRFWTFPPSPNAIMKILQKRIYREHRLSTLTWLRHDTGNMGGFLIVPRAYDK